MKLTGQQCANAAEAAVTRIPPILYTVEDCQGFVENTVRRAGGEITDYRGSNDMFRNACSQVFPLGQVRLQPGMVLFIHAFDGGEPDQYKADGLGNASHVGWYTGGIYEVVHSGATKGQVSASTLKNGWTHAGYLKGVEYKVPSEEPNPPTISTPGYINVPVDENVFLRISPNTDSPWLARINGGERVEVLKAKSDWTNVLYDGKNGYVMTKFITTKQVATPAEPSPLPVDNVAIKAEAINLLDRLKAIINLL